MEYYVFLMNKSIPTKEELEYNGENRYDDLVFICLNEDKEIRDYVSKFDDENISHYYFVVDENIKSKNKLFSIHRYYSGVLDNSFITERICNIEKYSLSSIEYYVEEECDIPNTNGKINIYSNQEVNNNFLNVIKIDEDDILKCYLEELNCDHEYGSAFFYYLFDKELYKIDLTKPYLYKEKYVANKVNQLEMNKQYIANNIRINKRFVIYLIDSDEIEINTNMNYSFIKVKDETEMFRSVIKISMTFCYSVYFVIKNNDTICLKWRLMDFRRSRHIKNIEDEININIYSNKEIEGYNTIIAESSLKAYEMEIYKDHYGRNGYFLYIKDGVITRLSIIQSYRNEKIVQGDLKDIIYETNGLDWRNRS